MRNDKDTPSARPATGRTESTHSALRSAMEAGITGGVPMMFLPQPSATRATSKKAAVGKARSKLAVALLSALLLAALWFGLSQPVAGTSVDASPTDRPAEQKPQSADRPADHPADHQTEPTIYSRPRGLPAG